MSDSESYDESDNEVMEDSDNEVMVDDDEPIAPKKPIVLKDMIVYAEYKTLSDENKKIYGMCESCSNFYDKSKLMAKKKYMDMDICYHCLFFINYSPEERIMVDGSYGISISDYVLTWAKDHIPCNRTCFICDFTNGIAIEHIKNSDILFPKNSNIVTGNIRNNKIVIAL